VTACTPGSAQGPTLGNEYGKPLPLPFCDHDCKLLLYASEVCNLDKKSMNSLNFTLNIFFMKLFKTSDMEIVKHCHSSFGCELPSVLLKKRHDRFTGTVV